MEDMYAIDAFQQILPLDHPQLDTAKTKDLYLYDFKRIVSVRLQMKEFSRNGASHAYDMRIQKRGICAPARPIVAYCTSGPFMDIGSAFVI